MANLESVKNGNFIKKSEIILLVIILVLNVAFSFFMLDTDDGAYVVVTRNNLEKYRYPLDKDRIIDVDGIMTIEISGGKVCVLNAECPDKLCVKAHAIKTVGSSIVCLPNKVVIVIEGNSNEVVV